MPLLAMHMANELLSLPVAAVLFALAVAAVGLSGRSRPGSRLDGRVALMGVMGAFVFAAQMINFPLPLFPGTSGHLVGAVLLAILLGPRRAVLVMTAVLTVQCLVFQDGGLLALGANILNMGVVPAFLGYGIYRLVVGRSVHVGSRVYLGSFLAAMAAVCAGATLVPLECAASGVISVPVSTFLGVMLSIHAVIGVIEGVITFAVVAYVYRTRPDWLGVEAPWQPVPRRVVIASLCLGAFVLAGGVSLLASSLPDGLEWSYAERPDQPDFAGYVAPAEPIAEKVDHWQERLAPLPAYGEHVSESWGTPLAGVIGTAVVLGVVYFFSLLRRRPAHSSAVPAPD